MIDSKAVRKKCPSTRSEASGPAKQFYTVAAFERNIARGAHRSIISWRLRLKVILRALHCLPLDSSALLLSLSLMFGLRMALIAPRHATNMFTRAFLVFAFAQIEVETNWLSTWRLVMHPMELLWHRLALAFASSFAFWTRVSPGLVDWLLSFGVDRVRFLVIISLATQRYG